MNKRILAHLALFAGIAGMVDSHNYRIGSEETQIKKSYYKPEPKREFDKNGDPIKRTAKGKRKSKKRKR